MTVNDQIRQIAARPEGLGPFLTLYIDTNRGDATQNDRLNERLLASKVILESRGVALPSFGSDLLEGDTVEAVFSEQPLGRSEESLLGVPASH